MVVHILQKGLYELSHGRVGPALTDLNRLVVVEIWLEPSPESDWICCIPKIKKTDATYVWGV